MSVDTILLDELLQKYVVSNKESPALLRQASLVVKDRSGRTLYSNAVGSLNYEGDSPPFTPDSICTVASMSKLVTSVCAMQLVERGVLGLDDDLGKVVPELAGKEYLKGFLDDGSPFLVKATKPITLRTLLTHSSGIAYDFDHPDLIKWAANRGRTVDFHSYTLEGYTYPLVFEPGEGWTYGAGVDWAGVAIERLTNSTLEEYMQQNIFQPLGMASSTFTIAQHPEFTSRRATVGVRPSPDNPPVPSHDNGPESPEQLGGGGGLFTTANDYAKFLGALISGDDRVLNAKSREEIFRPQLPNPKQLQEHFDGPLHDWLFPQFPRGLPVNYGLGGLVNLQDVPKMRRKGSLTWCGATSSHWFIDRDTGIAATYFTQLRELDPVAAEHFIELENLIYKTFKVE